MDMVTPDDVLFGTLAPAEQSLWDNTKIFGLRLLMVSVLAVVVGGGLLIVSLATILPATIRDMLVGAAIVITISALVRSRARPELNALAELAHFRYSLDHSLRLMNEYWSSDEGPRSPPEKRRSRRSREIATMRLNAALKEIVSEAAEQDHELLVARLTLLFERFAEASARDIREVSVPNRMILAELETLRKHLDLLQHIVERIERESRK